MRSWLTALIIEDIEPAHLRVCDRCAAEFHGDCLLARKAIYQPCTCECRRRACRRGKKQKWTRKDDGPIMLVLQPREKIQD